MTREYTRRRLAQLERITIPFLSARKEHYPIARFNDGSARIPPARKPSCFIRLSHAPCCIHKYRDHKNAKHLHAPTIYIVPGSNVTLTQSRTKSQSIGHRVLGLHNTNPFPWLFSTSKEMARHRKCYDCQDCCGCVDEMGLFICFWRITGCASLNCEAAYCYLILISIIISFKRAITKAKLVIFMPNYFQLCSELLCLMKVWEIFDRIRSFLRNFIKFV